MGNEQSSGPYEGPPETLEGRDIASVAKYMKSEACKNVFVMNGAGVSTSAGIPDFRSPGTGLYHNLERLNLPYPEAVFEINFFRSNPAPFYTLAKELMPGKYRPTPTHSFVKLLHNRGLLRMCYTQNIDTLERLAGLPDHAIVEAHGSFADQHCIECGSRYDGAKLRDQILQGEIAYCNDCGGLVKPDIVFFGESLPSRFHKTITLLRSADLLIIMGTSLKVHPFASLTQLVPQSCPRVLINLDPAGDIGSGSDDVVLLGKSDDVVRELCQELGDDWADELDALWRETEKYGPSPKERIEEEVPKREVEELKKAGEPKLAEAVQKVEVEIRARDKLEDDVEKLANAIATSLDIGAVPSSASALQPEEVGERKEGQEGKSVVSETEVRKDKERTTEDARGDASHASEEEKPSQPKPDAVESAASQSDEPSVKSASGPVDGKL